MLKLALCDDSVLILDSISSIIGDILEKYHHNFTIDKYTNGELLLENYNNKSYDVVFLDIDMPTISGFEIAKKIREQSNSNCYIIFITSHSELVYDSFDFQPFNFIRKTSKEEIEKNLHKVLEKLILHIKQNEIFVFDDNLNGKLPISIRDIMYIESDKHYINYYVQNIDNNIRIRETMKNCEEKYINMDFIKIHKKYLVNMRYIATIDNNLDEVKLKNGKRLPMSRNYKKSVDSQYIMYLRSNVW